MRRSVNAFFVVLTLTAGCANKPEQPASNATAAGHGGHAASPAGRTTLLGNLGSYHRAIKTTSPDAQKFFDEGLTLLYGFNHEEAYRSFERAAALDDKTPMPHWGMSLALGTNYNDTATPDRIQQAYAHVTHAQQRAANGSDVERSFVDALARRYVATPDDDNQRKREEAYSAAMGEVSKKFPDDLDAATLYAESMMNLRPWKLYTPDGIAEPGTEEIVATLERVLARNADHPGANHYLIHAVEASRTPERAEASAKRLETLVPAAGHLVHMPSHIWMRTGEYQAAAKTNADAALLDERYVKQTGATGLYPTMYYGHNLQFESAAAMFAGNFAAARAAGQKTVALVAPMAGDMAMLQPFTQQEVFVLVRFERWNEVLAQPAPPADRALQNALFHFARAAAYAGKGQPAEAIKEQSAFEAAAAKVPKDGMYLTNNSAPIVLEVARQELVARIADAQGGGPKAIAAWKAAVTAEDKVNYDEPPAWLLPTREGLAAALMRAGNAAEAEKVYRDDLARNRKNPRSLFGLSKALERQKKTAEAAKVKTEFEAAWSGADVQLTDAALAPRKSGTTGL
jgi:hypothetical protein